MKTLLPALLLLGSNAAAQPCQQIGEFRWDLWSTSRMFQFENLKAQHYAHIDFLPTGTGVAVLLFFNTSANEQWYGEQMVWTDPLRQYRWEAPSCGTRSWRTLALWWDDRDNAPRPNDVMFLNSYSGQATVQPWRVPSGMLSFTSVELAMEPRIERQHEPPHWNQETNKPAMWAVLIQPVGGWW